MSVKHWLDQVNPQLRTAGHAGWGPHHVEPERILYDHELVVFVGGPCRVEIDGVVYVGGDSTFLIVPPQRRHSTVNLDRPVHRYWVHFDWVFSRRRGSMPLWVVPPSRARRERCRTAPSFIPPGVFHGPLLEPARVIALLRDLSLRWSTQDPRSRGTCRALLLEVLLILLGEPSSHPLNREVGLALEAKAALETVAIRGGSVQSALADLGYSYEHLCRLFRRSFGLSPVGYVHAVRIARARRLLTDPRLSIAQVAFESGFQDPGYFTRVFRRTLGVSPSQYLAGKANPSA